MAESERLNNTRGYRYCLGLSLCGSGTTST